MTTMRKIRFNASHPMGHYQEGETRWVGQDTADYYTLAKIGTGIFMAEDITPQEEPVAFPIPLPTPERPLGSLIKEKGWLQSFFDACHIAAIRDMATPLAFVATLMFIGYQTGMHLPQINGFINDTIVLASGLSDMGERELAVLSPFIVAEGK